MDGSIISIKYDRHYGFIKGNDGEDYYFNERDVQNTLFSQLEKNDKVTFDPVVRSNGNRAAFTVKKVLYNYENLIGESEEKTGEIKTGIHKLVRIDEFTEREQAVINKLSKLFFITNADTHIRLGYSSEYSYCLIKPTRDIKMLFNLTREIIVVLSKYNKFEPRVFDVISDVHKKIGQELRLEKMCSLIICNDPNTKDEVQAILNTSPEMQVIIPFSFTEIIDNGTEELIISRLREFFYEKDLFDVSSPLKKEIHFFGRKTYVNELISRHSTGENSGVFGLRRSGKTSVLQAVIRASELINTVCVFEDCQGLYHSRWNIALFDVICKIASGCGVKGLKISKDDYTSENASASFDNHLKRVLNDESHPSVLLMFDEIEWISPGSSPEEPWKSGNDFIMFWQVIRKNFNQYGSKFTFILAGTNPSAIELITINSYDNPLFNQIKTDSYLPSFTVDDTSDMVNKLGGYMGLRFDDIVCSRLTQDFGGHPFLIRQFCSAINNYLKSGKIESKPITITSAIYDRVMPQFKKNQANLYCKLIMDVLVNNYNQEYKYIEDFALGNIDDSDLDNIEPQMLSHLMGYNILENNNGIYGFKIDILKNYLICKNEYKRKNLTQEEKLAEISERRNKIEKQLRRIVKKQLKFILGEQKAKECVLRSMQPQNKQRYENKKYEELFDPKACEIYLSQLSLLIDKNWDTCFKNVFSKNRKTIKHYVDTVNYYRADAHADDVSDEQLIAFRESASGLEVEIKKYFEE